MIISKIKVTNFRQLEDFELDLEKKLSLIIGKNNCGKTSFLLLLDKFLSGKKGSHYFDWNDFSLSFQAKLESLIAPNDYTEATPSDILLGISLSIFIQYDSCEDISNISDLLMDLTPENNTVVINFQYVIQPDSLMCLTDDYKAHLEELKTKGNSPPNTFSAYMKSKYKKYFKIFKHSVGFDHETQSVTKERAIIENDALIKKIICFKSINARRAVSNAETNNTLSILSSRYYDRIAETEDLKGLIDQFQSAISTTDKAFDEIYEGLFEKIISKVSQFGGTHENDTAIKIISSLQRRELLKGNTTVMYQHDSDCQLPENYNGLGYLNLIGMVFEIEIILAEFRKGGESEDKPSAINLFFIEEPEAHTHPQLQHIFIRNIKQILREGCDSSAGMNDINLQTIITTHSPHIVSESEFDDIKYFHANDQHYIQSKNLKDLQSRYEAEGDVGKQRFKFLKQYLTIHRAELFFADKAIFIEGDTERILMPAMMKKIDMTYGDGVPLLSQNISVIEAGAYAHIFEQLIDFLGIKSLIITDLDPAKKSESGHLCGCPIDEAETTSNGALKYFFKDIFNGESTQFDGICSLEDSEKVLTKRENGWGKSDDGHGQIRIAFQTPEKGHSGGEYQACSFEDAFINLNRSFISGQLDRFESLKNTSFFSKKERSPYDLAKKCIGKKTSFALEILMASTFDDPPVEPPVASPVEPAKLYSNWETPAYIKEGLEWLKN